jgi:hypothetical protein
LFISYLCLCVAFLKKNKFFLKQNKSIELGYLMTSMGSGSYRAGGDHCEVTRKCPMMLALLW